VNTRNTEVVARRGEKGLRLSHTRDAYTKKLDKHYDPLKGLVSGGTIQLSQGYPPVTSRLFPTHVRFLRLYLDSLSKKIPASFC